MAKKKGSRNKSSATKSVPKNPKPISIADSINTEVIAEALSAAVGNQPVLFKLCRLCESKDGPFHNIFDADKIIAKKIDDLLPFGIEENDDLPHKICFRCSAKVEELYEFVQKCIRTQVSLRKAMGKTGQLNTKPKTRALWEEKLNQSNMSNDDICNALIQKAMEGIKDIPLNPLPLENDDKPIGKKDIKNDPPVSVIENNSKKKNDNNEQEPIATAKEPEKKEEKVPIARPNRSSNVAPSEDLAIKSNKPAASELKENDSSKKEKERGIKRKLTTKIDEPEKPEPVKKDEEKLAEVKEEKKPFNIMDHISMIKVNGVGVLFQCKLCTRNFLKKEIVQSHSCAKNGGAKQEAVPEYLPPMPPKMPVVKYINTKSEGLHPKTQIINEKPIALDDDPPPAPVAPPPAPTKPKPKIGPASKVKKYNTESNSTEPPLSTNQPPSTQDSGPIVQFPSLPSLNSRYKLVSGPNNTFTLVEEKVVENSEYVSSDDSNLEKPKVDKESKKKKSKLKHNESKGNKSAENAIPEAPVETNSRPNMPYPVGLIKRPGHSNDYTPPSGSIAFTTPAMKKQSYTIVQTGNPSKLLISTKPQSDVEEVPKKKARKTKHESAREENSGQPFSVTLEDAARPKDSGFFTFINVDPLLQPSYVLPTDNIIQESQISTSTTISKGQAGASKEKERDNDKYSCNMCGDKFSREKKLLAHIQSHYTKMDEEDQKRGVAVKKRGKKS